MKNRLAKQIAALLTMVLLATTLVWAVQTSLTPITPLGPYLVGAPTATSLDFAFTACDTGNGNKFAMTGRDVLLIQNSGASPYTVTISSVADQYGRTQDITAYSVGAGLFSAFNFRNGTTGFRQTDGTVHLACSNAAIMFAVITTPN
jgi:hypothetical protein